MDELFLEGEEAENLYGVFTIGNSDASSVGRDTDNTATCVFSRHLRHQKRIVVGKYQLRWRQQPSCLSSEGEKEIIQPTLELSGRQKK